MAYDFQNIAANQGTYTATCIAEPSLVIHITAASDEIAKCELLDKIGYDVIPDHANDGQFLVVDVDDESDILMTVHGSLVNALDDAIRKLGWRMSEREELIGGHLGAGFGKLEY